MSPPLILAKAGNEIMVNNKVKITLKTVVLILLLKIHITPYLKSQISNFFQKYKNMY